VHTGSEEELEQLRSELVAERPIREERIRRAVERHHEQAEEEPVEPIADLEDEIQVPPGG
jgi:hypothetical protein